MSEVIAFSLEVLSVLWQREENPTRQQQSHRGEERNWGLGILSLQLVGVQGVK